METPTQRRLSTRAASRIGSRRQGEHNDEVLHELGYGDDEISGFTDRGVLCTAAVRTQR
jgi:crotonobetainyl-CoA:carnitine CoA-transferase CaiB-like acyl-CoA transferase